MNRLKELRFEKGYAKIKIQMLTGIHQSNYSKIENGKCYYAFEQCRKIAVAMDTGVDYLVSLNLIYEKKPYPREARQLT